MKKIGILKYGVCMALAAVMAVGLCACGKQNTGANERKHFYSVQYIDNLPDTMGGNMGSVRLFGDSVIYQMYTEDYNGNTLYRYDIVNGTNSKIWECANEVLEDGTNVSNSYIQYFAMDKQNNLYMYLSESRVTEESLNKDYTGATYDDVINRIMEMWQESEEGAKQEWDDWFAAEFTDEDGNVDYARFMKNYGMEWVSQMSLIKVDAEGNPVFRSVLSEQKQGEEQQYYIDCRGLACDGEYLYMGASKWDNTGMGDEYYVEVFAPDGTKKGKIDFDGYISEMYTMPNGKIAVGDWGGENYVLRELDGERLSVAEEGITVGDGYMNGMTPCGDDKMLIRENTSLSLYDMKTKTSERLLSFMDYNIASSSVNSFGQLSDGRLVVFSNSYNNAESRYKADLAVLTEVDEKDLPEVEYINVACMWLDSNVESLAIEFNKKHEGYHISIGEYYDQSANTYEDNLRAFTTAVASDKSIDLVIFNDYSQVVNFAAKGLLADMYPLLEGDDQVAKEDLMPNVLTACEVNGKLACLPTSFTLQTVVGKVSDVGTTPGWTMADMKALLDSKPQGTQLFYGMTREQALRVCLNLGYKNYIDVEKGTCSFNSQDFIDALEFANLFPETFEWQEDEDSSVLMNQGKVLLSEFYLSDFAEIQMYETIFADKLTYIGYPTTEGNGAMISLNNIYGITKNCKHQDVAWEFLRQFYLPKAEGSDGDAIGRWGFSVRKDEFEKYCADAMKPIDGGWSWGWGSFQVEIQPATQEQVDMIKDLVYHATSVNGAMSDDVMNIINEEVAYYFSGEQSAQSVAEKIQSRMQIYLSETK